MSEDEEEEKPPKPPPPPMLGWSSTRMTCTVCGRRYTVTHPFDAVQVKCPDCGCQGFVVQGEPEV